MKLKFSLLTIGSVALLILMSLVFTPVPIPDEGECLVDSGVVTNIYESGSKDITLILSGHRKRYYINRGLERGLQLNEVGTALLGRKVVIKYPDYWTPLDPKNSIRHVSKSELDGQTIFTELQTKAAEGLDPFREE